MRRALLSRNSFWDTYTAASALESPQHIVQGPSLSASASVGSAQPALHSRHNYARLPGPLAAGRFRCTSTSSWERGLTVQLIRSDG